MLVADAKTNPEMDALAQAAQEIAQLKAQVTRLEKTVDGLLAQRFAGQEASIVVDPQSETFFAGSDVHDMDQPCDALCDDSSETQPTDEPIAHLATPHLAGDQDAENAEFDDDFVWSAADSDGSDDTDELDGEISDEEIVFGEIETGPITEEHAAPVKLIHGSLPNAVRNLICNPAPDALSACDDLTLIQGISAETALGLAAHNLNRFDALADLDADTAALIKADVPGADHLHANGWIEQAAILRTGALTRYAEDLIETRAASQEPVSDSHHAEATTESDSSEPDNLPVTDTSYAPDADDACTSGSACANNCDSCQHVAKDIFEISEEDETPTPALQTEEIALPRSISISVLNVEHPCDSDAEKASFLPMGAKDAGFAVQKIAHTPVPKPRDWGHARALSASLAATAFIVVGATVFGGLSLNTSVSSLLQADVCKVAGFKSLPQTCKIFSSNVL